MRSCILRASEDSGSATGQCRVMQLCATVRKSPSRFDRRPRSTTRRRRGGRTGTTQKRAGRRLAQCRCLNEAHLASELVGACYE